MKNVAKFFVSIKNSPVANTKTFTFDRVFGTNSKQIEVYNQVVRPLVMEVIEGYNCTIFAYGQTGTGKTFTMEGDRTPAANPDEFLSWEDDPLVGIIPRAVSHLFSVLNSLPNCEYSVKISYIELYNEELSDLLNESIDSNKEEAKLRIFDDSTRKGSIMIPGLEEVIVKNKTEVYKILQKGAERRQKASTLMNSQSSRSHSIFTVTVFIKEKSIEGEEIIKVGKLNLVDLAGSENIERSGATGKRAAEAGKINKSLTTLGRVITALVERRDHIPYRESNLTRLLQDSLGGKTKTSIIATISPALCNLEETLSTLDYAHKAKSIRNKPEINQKLVKKALIKEYTEEIERLKKELISTRDKNGIYMPTDVYEDMQSRLEMQKVEIRDLLQRISGLSLEIEKLNSLFEETKQNLDEKETQLFDAQTKLQTTQNSMESIKSEIGETRYLLQEQVKTENKLLSQAEQLLAEKIETQADCAGLHDKLDRLNQISNKNKSSVNKFASEMSEMLARTRRIESETSESNTNRFCSLCQLLQNLSSKISESKSDNQFELEAFNESQAKIFAEHNMFVKRELRDYFIEKFENLIKKIDEDKTEKINMFTRATDLCIAHKYEFDVSYNELNKHIQSMEANNMTLECKFNDLSNKFVAKRIYDLNEMCNNVTLKLNSLTESMNSFKLDLNEMYNMKKMHRNNLNEALNGVFDCLKKITTSVNESLNQMDVKYDLLKRQTDTYLDELNSIKELVKQNCKNCISSMTAEYEQDIEIPVKSLFQYNTSSFNDLKNLCEDLSVKDNEISTTMKSSLNNFIMHENTVDSTMVASLISHQTELVKNAKKMLDNLEGHQNQTEQFVQEYSSESVQLESDKLSEMVDSSIAIVNETKSACDAFCSSTRDFISESSERIQKFSENEYLNDVSTGRTPKSKTYVNNVSLERTMPHPLLIENYRNLNQLEKPSENSISKAISPISRSESAHGALGSSLSSSTSSLLSFSYSNNTRRETFQAPFPKRSNNPGDKENMSIEGMDSMRPSSIYLSKNSSSTKTLRPIKSSSAFSTKN